jgi:dTDP-glucose 4,6-dehydratase
VICHGSNNYAPRQQPEKLIPLCLLNALNGDSLPRNGDGRHIRNYVTTSPAPPHGAARRAAGRGLQRGWPDECENIEEVRRILELAGRDEGLIEYVRDRPGHERRYWLSSEKIRWELGWEPRARFAEGLERTVEWYRANEWWWGPIRSGGYRECYERRYGRALSGS